MATYIKVANDIPLAELFSFFNEHRHLLESVHFTTEYGISRKVYNRDMKEDAIKRMVSDNELMGFY